MAVSKIRCAACRVYVSPVGAITVGISRVCSEDCLKDLSAKRRPVQKTYPSRNARVGRLDAEIRALIRKRDGERCRWCGRNGSSGLQIHHVHYRSEGGQDVPHNLILLCADHHAVAHSNKKYWQPVLLASLWIGYIHERMLTIPEVERYLLRHSLIEPRREHGRQEDRRED